MGIFAIASVMAQLLPFCMTYGPVKPPPKQVFPKLFHLTGTKDASVKDVWNSVRCIWSLNFRRLLKDDEIPEWAAFTHLLPNLSPTGHEDSWTSKHHTKGFSTKSLYTHLTFNMLSLTDSLFKMIWRCPYPKRVKFLLWEMTNSCLNTMERLQKRCPWINLSPSWCCLCQSNNESLQHGSFFIVLFSREIWNEVFDTFNWLVVLPYEHRVGSDCWYVSIHSKLQRGIYG